MNRYHRQIIFPGWGEAGQAKLAKASVVQVGCGGLGSTLSQCMVRAGVARLTLIDKDVVDITNLPRQFLFDENDARKKYEKAIVSEEKLKKADSSVDVRGIVAEFSASNADRLLSGHDLVLDGTDNMLSRYIINDWCVKHHIPWIYGGVVGATGMLMPILPGEGPCLRCLYPDPETTIVSSEVMPIINTLPVVIAALQATEAIKILINSPDLIRHLKMFDLWSGEYQQLSIPQNPRCPCCIQKEFAFLCPKE